MKKVRSFFSFLNVFISEKAIPFLLLYYFLLPILLKLPVLLFIIFIALYLFLVVVKRFNKDSIVYQYIRNIHFSTIVYLFLALALSIQSSLWLLFLTIVFILVPLKIKERLEKSRLNMVTAILSKLYVELVFFYLALLTFIYGSTVFVQFLETKSLYFNVQKIGETLIVLSIVLLMIITFRIIFVLLKEILISSKRFLFSRVSMIMLVSLLIFIILVPPLSFSIIYDLFATVYEFPRSSYWDLIYFSFALQYVVPMYADLEVFQLTAYLNIEAVGRVVQFSHIVFSKVIDFIILASVIGLVIKLVISRGQESRSLKG